MSYLGQAPGQGQAEYFLYTASGSETSVTTADDGRVVSYTVGQVSVYLNGVKLVEGTSSAPKDFIASDGSAISGLANLTANDVVEVVALSAFSPSDTVSAANGGTFAGNVIMSGNLTVNGTTTTIDTQHLIVEDKNIEMGKVSSPTDTTADGGGLTLKGDGTAPYTDKTILWEKDTKQWNVNQKWTENAGSSAWHRPLTTQLGLS